MGSISSQFWYPYGSKFFVWPAHLYPLSEVSPSKEERGKAVSPIPGPEHEGYLKIALNSQLILNHEARTDQSNSESKVQRSLSSYPHEIALGTEPLQGVYMLQIC